MRIWSLDAHGLLSDRYLTMLTRCLIDYAYAVCIPAANPQASRRDSATISLLPCSKPLRQFCTMSYTFCRMSVLRVAPLAEVAVIRRFADPPEAPAFHCSVAAHLTLDPHVAATAGRHTCVPAFACSQKSLETLWGSWLLRVRTRARLSCGACR